MHVLLNWLVLGTALTLAVILGVRLRRTLSAATRERIWWITLIAVALMPVAYLAADVASGVPPSARLPAPPDPWLKVQPSWHRWTTLVASAWAAWAVASVGRVGLALAGLRRAKRTATPFPPEREARLPAWSALRGRGRLAELVVSTRVHRAAVLGLMRPQIAVAPDTIAQLTDDELDQVVLHEYAHLQRRDDLGILGQRLLSAVAGLHPAVWWLDRALTIDREMACDDWVVTYAGTRTAYARCLIKLASCAPPSRWTAAPGIVRSPSQLAIRVTSLLDRRRRVAIAPSTATLAIALPAVVALLMACVTMPLAGVARDRQVQIIAHAVVLTGTLGDPWDPAVPPAAPPPRPLRRRTPAPLPSPPGPPAALPDPDDEVRVTLAPLVSTPFALWDLAVDPGRPAGSRLASPAEETRWSAAATVGLAMGHGSRRAALKTAGFFSRLGTSLASTF